MSTYTQYEYANFDPYEVLQVNPETSTVDISKRRYSLTQFGVVWQSKCPFSYHIRYYLSSWVVEKENAIWVLGVCARVFVVALPVAVGSWWYRSTRYSGELVLLDTTQMHYYFSHKTPPIVLIRIVMILAASPEFRKRHNPEIYERPSDNFEVPQLMEHKPQLNEKDKKRPLCFSYSVKARALLHAHLSESRCRPVA